MLVRCCIMQRKGRRFLECQWTDRVTGRKRTESTGTANRRDAERFRAKLERDLNDGTYGGPVKTDWASFVAEYETVKLAGLSKATKNYVKATIAHVEESVRPKKPSSIGPQQVLAIEKHLLGKGLAPVTVANHLNNLRRLLEWARRKRYVAMVPEFDIPGFSEKSKGRPITADEFDKMLNAVDTLAGKSQVPLKEPATWKFLLEGLWWSGLRLNEAASLHWTDDSQICVDFSGKRPVFRIQVIIDKARQSRVFPVAPEFAAFLEKIPEAERTGYVFSPGVVAKRRLKTDQPDVAILSRTIKRIGDAAEVWTGIKRSGETSPAGAHDLRRSFGERWSWRVVPRVLQALMRHRSIRTTQMYYQSHDAQEIADRVWDAFDGLVVDGHLLGNAG